MSQSWSAIVSAMASGLSERAEEIFGGITMFIAVAMLTYMVVWMKRQAVNMKAHLSHHRGHLGSGARLGHWLRWVQRGKVAEPKHLLQCHRLPVNPLRRWTSGLGHLLIPGRGSVPRCRELYGGHRPASIQSCRFSCSCSYGRYVTKTNHHLVVSQGHTCVAMAPFMAGTVGLAHIVFGVEMLKSAPLPDALAL